jgi:hypothetical protein
MYEGPLGQRPPSDKRHIEKYPLTAATEPDLPTPVVLGVPWYTNFDRPVAKRSGLAQRYYIGQGDLGRVRGGHCVCLPAYGFRDTPGWWAFYDQGSEGACVGFGVARMLSHLNRKRYDARDIYRRAQRIDEWPGEAYSGTSVRAGLDVVREEGPRVVRGKHTYTIDLDEGIKENRWALGVEDILNVTAHVAGDGTVPILNSWGVNYPKAVWLPIETLDRLLREDGEASIVTDRVENEGA